MTDVTTDTTTTTDSSTDTTTVVLTSDQQLYKNLMALCDDKDNLFYNIDATTPMQEKVRIFNYHYVSYSDWLKDDALECRGIMFTIDDKGEMISLISRPMAKFFNLNEHNVNINNLCELLIKQGLLSQDVYDSVKT